MKLSVFVVLFITLISGVFAYTSFTGVPSSYDSVVRPDFQNYYGSEGRLQQYWPILTDAAQCVDRQDIIIQVSPAGCQPAVVRSDLLAEQNVPVFCQLDALTLNPLLDVKSIDSITFSGNYPKEIVGSGFHPARAALRTYDRLLGDPIINNIGYVVVVVKKQPDERNLPDLVNVTLQARIRYDADNALGVGRAEFLLEEQSDAEWARERSKQSFWQGQFFARLEDADSNSATVTIYQGDRQLTSVRVNRGETSREFFLPGLYCRAGLRVAYDGFVPAETSAVITIDNERLEVTRGSKFLNNRCTVNSVSQENGQSILRVSCLGKSYLLSISERSFDVGDIVSVIDNPVTNWTVVYVQRTGFSDSARYTLNETIHGETTGKQITAQGSNLSLVYSDRLVDKEYDSTIEQQFGRSMSIYREVADSYGSERDSALSTSYGELALNGAFELAQKLGKDKTAIDLINELIDDYPSSASQYSAALSSLSSKDSSQSSVALFVDGETKIINLVDVHEPKQPQTAYFTWGALPQQIPVILYNSTRVAGVGNITLESSTVDSVRVRVACDDRNVSSATLRVGDGGTFVCGQTLVLDEAFIGSQARIRLLPSVENLETQTNVSVVVGIEKRAITLTPDKAKENLVALNQTIKQWESISNNLGNAVKGLKAACFATAGVLTVKNFLTGLSGEGIARQKVMREHWNLECSRLVSAGTYASLGECYYKETDNINKDVAVTQQLLQAENSQIESIESKYSEPVEGVGSLFGETIVDRSRAANDFARDELVNKYSNSLVNGKKVSDLVNLSGGYDRGEFTYDEIRDMRLNLDILASDASPGMKAAAQESLNRIGKSIDESAQLSRSLEVSKQDELSGLPTIVGTPFSADASPSRYVSVVSKVDLKDASLAAQFPSTVDYVTRVPVKGSVRVVGDTQTTFSGGSYVIGLRKQGDNYVAEKVLYFNSSTGQYSNLNDKEPLFLDSYNLGSVQSYDQVSYNNKYILPKLRYYETEPYKGMPAIVPFDTQRGWYAATKQTLPSFGGIGSFDSSGRVTSLWICNVGKNGQEQFYESLADDVCQQVNLNTGQALDQFPGLDEQQARVLISRGVEAVQDAARQYAAGKKIVQIRGLSGTETLTVGDPAIGIPATQCQNYMSPEECRLLFNVCDPVICPSSRCDFGGAYPVADVIQTGIVGSALLCLPNFREGIYIPVCLTGIKAGIDGYVSILKSHQLCLQENIESGKYVGICDEITAIYTCEFFWRQAAPLANIALPKLVEVATGQTAAHGGGEYLTTQAAWQHAQDSVNYFTQTYAVNALEAFKIRSVEEAGGTFCKAFISGKAPAAFEALVEPDSPAQFHAWFSTTPFTDATVPPSSQYKVFYHIYSGNDQGVSYAVYLKDPPQTSYYQTTQTISVATGYVPKGQFATETKDFTAPEGYKQLCVRINNKEECGFQQVSTSFAVNALRDSYASDELTRTDITSEQSCISGGALAGEAQVGALLQPNLQAGAEEFAFGQVYNRGIVRICATDNPGSRTDPNRFVDTGYCGDKKIRCWLDTTSVDNALTINNNGTREQTLTELEEIQKQTLVNRKVIYDDATAASRLDELVAQRSDLASSLSPEGYVQAVQNLVKEIDISLDNFFYNHQKARLILLKAQVYDDYTRYLVALRTSSASTTGAPQAVQQAPAVLTVQDFSLRGNLLFVGELADGLYTRGSGTDVSFYYDVSGPSAESLRVARVINGRIELTISLANENRIPQTVKDHLTLLNGQQYNSLKKLSQQESQGQAAATS